MTDPITPLNSHLINIGLDEDADFLRQAVQLLSQMLMKLGVELQVGAGKHERTPERMNYRYGHRYLDMQVLEDVPEVATVTDTFEVLTHDAALPEMYMKGSYPDCEGANLHIIYAKNKHIHSHSLTILDTTSISKYYIIGTLIFSPLTFGSDPLSIDPFPAQVVENAEAH